ncbi:MAG: T9SS type A sorting domain-containing protein [Nonlabens sp.]|uniref:T9SS type A sorting domain-containing protein n=1 Tax=Nonlabens sp. TaxID=1888209 RepID=UPI003EF8FE66
MKNIILFLIICLSCVITQAQTADDLIDETMATHVASIDGDWFTAAIWKDLDGNAAGVPGKGAIVHIPEERSVTYDGSSMDHIFAIRVDGSFKIEENTASETSVLRVDTFFGSSSSKVILIGNTIAHGNIELILAPFDIEAWKLDAAFNWNSVATAHFKDGEAVEQVTYTVSGKTRFNTFQKMLDAQGTINETIVSEDSRDPYDDGVGVTGRYSWDPGQLSIGLVTMGKIQIEGRKKTNMVMLSSDAARNDTSFSLTSAPTGWEQGDLLLVTSSGKHGLAQNGEDEVILDNISGTSVSLASGEKLRKNHEGRPADAVFNEYVNSYVGNLTRNIVIRSEVTGLTLPQIHQRGHVMSMPKNHMHTGGMHPMNSVSDISIQNAQFKDLGRTDKSRLNDDLIWSNYVEPKTLRSKISPLGQEIAESYRPANEDITNSRGRYSIHLHKTGSKFGDSLAVVKGNVVWGNPGWGITQHDSYADVSENIVYDVIGAGIVSESGSETGFWKDNLVTKIAKGHTNDVYQSHLIYNDNLFSGQGLGMKGRAVVCDGNVITNTNQAIGIMNMAANKASTDRVDAKQLATVRPMLKVDQWPLSVNGYSVEGDGVVPTEVPLIINNTKIIDANLGFKSIERDMGVNHESRSVFDGMIIWGVNQGMTITYQADYTFHDVLVTGKDSNGSTIGAYMWKHSHNHVFDGVAFEDLDYAVVASKLVLAGTGNYKTRNNGFTPWYFMDLTSARLNHLYEVVDEDNNQDTDYTNHADNPIHAKSSEFVSRPTTFTSLDSVDLKVNYTTGDFKFAVDGIITDDLGAYKLGLKQAAAQGNLREGYPARFYEFASAAKLDEYVQENGVYIHPTDGYKYFIIDEYLPNRFTAVYTKFPQRVEIENAPTTGVYANPLEEPISNFLPQNQILSRLPETVVSQSTTAPTYDISFKDNAPLPVTLGADKAVDGNTNGRENAQFLQQGLVPVGSYMETNLQNKPWFEMDFGANKTIEFIDIWNTVDMHGQDIETNSTTFNNFRVMVSTQPFLKANGNPMNFTEAQANATVYNQLVSYTNNSDIPRKVSFNNLDIEGRYIRIQKTENSSILKLAEVEVVGRGVKPPVDFVYDNGVWTPEDPSGVSTYQDRAFVISGIAPLTGTMEIGELTIDAGSTLDLSSQDLLFTGNMDNSGTLLTTGSQVKFMGDKDVAITGVEMNIEAFVMEGEGTLTVNAPINIEKSLSLKDGVLDVTASEFTFLSTATSTAMLDKVENGMILGEVTTERFFPAKRAYRFYSSPVNTTSSIKDNLQQGVNNTGTAFPLDNLNPTAGYGTHISGSTTGANGFDATLTGNSSLYRFDNISQTWVAAPNTDVDVLVAGEPLRLFVRGSRAVDLSNNGATASDTKLAPKGEVVTGDVMKMLSPTTDHFNFVGNPYQSSVDVNSVLIDATNVNENFYYVWDPTRGTRGAYVTVMLPSGSNTSGSAANQFIQPGQSMFVQTLADGMSMLRFRESDKNINQNTTTFSAPQNQASLIARLYRNNGTTNQSIQDSFGIFFGASMNDGLDSLDAQKLSNQDETVGIDKNGVVYAIERRSQPQSQEVIQLSHRAYRDVNYTYQIELNGVLNNYVYLKDNYLNTLTLLNNGSNTYDFQIDNSIAGSIDPSRFELQFTHTTLNTPGVIFDDTMVIYPNPIAGNNLTIQSTQLNGKDVSYQLTNLLGQVIVSGSQSVNGNQFQIDNLSALSTGNYLLKLSIDGNEKTFKVVK